MTQLHDDDMLRQEEQQDDLQDEQPRGKKRSGGRAGSVFGAIFITLAVLCFAVSAVITYDYYQRYQLLETMQQTVSQSGFFPGITVYGQDVAGMEVEQAKAMLTDILAAEDAKRVINVNVEGQDYSLSLAATHNLDEVLIEAFNVGRTGELEERYALISGLAQAPQNFDVETTLDTSNIASFVQRIEMENLVPPVDATVSAFDPETRTFTFTDEAAGKHLMGDVIQSSIDSMLTSDDFSQTIMGQFEPLEPTVTKALLESQNKLLATFTTKTTNNSNRNTNVKLCAKAFNGLVVAPGEEFSMNTLTGPRTPAKGYKDAGTIKNGILVEEPGGGVCQVSSTLFNAVVRAGLEITERHCHSWPSDYVDIGMDAAIDYPAKDFKFRNNSEYPIYLVSTFADRKLTVEVYGASILEEGVTVELRSNIDSEIVRGEDIYEFDATLAAGDTVLLRKGRDGKRVTTFIRYMKGDDLVEEKILFTSNYPAIQAKYGYGPIV